MTEGELDFDAEELAMLRQLFRSEAQEALDAVTARLVAGGAAKPSAEALTEMMRVTHTLKGAAGTVGLPAMVELAHRLESALAALGREPSPWVPAAADVLLEVIDGMRGYVDHMTDDDAAARAHALRQRIDQLVPPSQRPESPPPPLPEPVLAAPDHEAGGEPSVPEAKPWLRVDPQRIDDLMASAGELLFDRTRIERRAQLLRTLAREVAQTRQSLQDALAEGPGGRSEDPPSRERRALVAAEAALAGQAALLSQTSAALLDEIEALRRTIGELSHGLTRVRLEPARSLMAHAARTLRGLRRATGQTVELRTEGEDVELDKAVAEQLGDPVTQLLRNAVAHGVEPAAERVAHGKPPGATITMRARQDGNALVLEVSDDGRGIDTAALRKRLVATGRWNAPRAALASDDDVLAALLETGVSTRKEADELAGRGVGLGLVRQTVARLGGEVSVSSQAGKGTTFVLRVPLSATLALAVMFKVAGQIYAIPSVYVIGTTVAGAAATTASFRGQGVPVLRLEQLLGHGATGERRPAIVVSFAGKTLACTVDKILGSRDIVIRPLGPLVAPLALYAGATISGSGKVQLILDPAQLVRRAHLAAPVAAVADDDAAAAALSGRALVVDDSRAIREAMTSMLGSEGWIVDVAEDGARALHMVHQRSYDLVVTDLEMPGLGGFELIAQLRADDGLEATPIIVITSRASPEHRRRARDLGVRAVVAKPITRRKLLEALAARSR